MPRPRTDIKRNTGIEGILSIEAIFQIRPSRSVGNVLFAEPR
jgi:hypothetical protein